MQVVQHLQDNHYRNGISLTLTSPLFVRRAKNLVFEAHQESSSSGASSFHLTTNSCGFDLVCVRTVKFAGILQFLVQSQSFFGEVLLTRILPVTRKRYQSNKLVSRHRRDSPLFGCHSFLPCFSFVVLHGAGHRTCLALDSSRTYPPPLNHP